MCLQNQNRKLPITFSKTNYHNIWSKWHLLLGPVRVNSSIINIDVMMYWMMAAHGRHTQKIRTVTVILFAFLHFGNNNKFKVTSQSAYKKNSGFFPLTFFACICNFTIPTHFQHWRKNDVFCWLLRLFTMICRMV